MDLVPCRFCGVVPEIIGRSAPNREWRSVRHDDCRSAYYETDEEAAAEWNAANTAPDPALLALAKMGAMVLGWFECGFPAIPGGVVDDMAVRSGCALEVSDGGGHACWTAPNIRLAIATLLAPDGAGEVADA